MKKHSILSCAVTGIGIGVPITLLCMILIGGFNAVVQEFLVWTAASALFGVLTGLIFLRKQQLSLPVSMVLHCLGCLLVATAACALCGYAEHLSELIISILPVFVVVYIVVYVVCFLVMKQEEKQINNSLNNQS